MAKYERDELSLPGYMTKKRGRAASSSETNAAGVEKRANEKDAGEKKRAAAVRAVSSAPEKKRTVQKRALPDAGKEHVKTSREAAKAAPGSAARLVKVLLRAALICAALVFAVKLLTPQADKATITLGGMPKTIPDTVQILGAEVGGMKTDEAEKTVQAVVDPLLAGAAVTLRCGDKTCRITGEDIKLAYDMDAALQEALSYVYVPAADTVVDVSAAHASNRINGHFTWNETRLRLALEEFAKTVDARPVNASIDGASVVNGELKFSFHAESGGQTLLLEETLAAIEAAFSQGRFAFEMDAPYSTQPPEITAAMLANAFLLRASYSTLYAVSEHDETTQNRVFNITKAAGLLDGCVVAPGEEWSFNGSIGLRTYEGGWKAANGIADGVAFTLQAGGGICQVSSTLYNALLCADIEVTDRRAHSIPSTYVPKGLDATVDSAGIDLKFRNNTDSPLYIRAFIEPVPNEKKERLTVELYGQPLEAGVTYATRSKIVETIRRTDVNYTMDSTIPRGYKVVTIEARDGYKAEAYRDKQVNGVFAESELLYTDSYKGNAEEARKGTGKPAYVPVPEGAVKIS